MAIVSTIIPVYNAEKWIASTINSLLSQIIRPDEMEVIVVDNNSSDNSVEIAESLLAKSPFSYRIISEKRQGVAIARNSGAKVAKGKWLQFLDADDILHQEKIKRQLDFARHHKDKFAVVFSPWKIMYEDNNSITYQEELRTPCPCHTDLASFLEDKNFIATGSQIIRKDLFFNIGGFDESFKVVEDVNLSIRLAYAGGCFSSCNLDNEPMFFYRKRSYGSLSTISKEDFLDACLANILLIEDLVKLKSITAPSCVKIDNDVLLKAYYHVARGYTEVNWEKFLIVSEYLEKKCVNFIPSKPFRLYLLSKMLGYRNAERVAFYYRKLRACLNI